MKKNHMPFTISFAVYLAAGIIAVILFAAKGSYLSRELAASAAVPDETVTAEQPEVSELPDVPEEPQETPETEIPEEPQAPELSKEPETPPAAPAQEDVITDSITDPSSDSDAATAPEDEPSADEMTTEDDEDEPSADEAATGKADDKPAADEAATDKAGDDGKTYYAFTVNDGVTGVRIRETADRNSKTVSHIDGGRSGYVLEQGDTRSKILTKKGTVGYIYNDYITISEIPRDDFPEEYR